MKLSELTDWQRLELKQHILSNKDKNVSYGELFNADELISDNELESEYGSTEFVEEDFCY